VALPDWDALAVELPPRALLTRAVLVVLTHATGGPSSAAELADMVWDLPVAHGEAKVRAVLRAEPCFTPASPGRWQLGARRC
jgi:hypothetical protein